MNARVASALLTAASLIGGLAAAPRSIADELFTTVDRTVAPGERALIRVRTDATGSATALLYRIEDTAMLFDGQTDFGNGAALYAAWKHALDAARTTAGNRLPLLPLEPSTGPSDERPAPTLTFISSTVVALTKVATAAPGQTLEVPVPASGLYLIEVRAGTRAALVSALVSRVTLVTKRDGARLVAFAVDRTGGTPIEGVALDVRSGGTSLATGKTDAKGLASIEGTFPATISVYGSIGDDLAYGDDTYVPADASTRRVYAFPHQPAYRPGERVEVKGVVRARRDGRYALDADVREVTVSFRAGNAKELGQATAVVSADLGTFAVGFDLPKDAATGDATLVVNAGGKQYAAPFRIEEYRKPVFEVTVTPKTPRVAAGDPLSFDVAALLYEGGVVSGGSLQWTVTYSRVDRELFPTDELASLFFGTEREAYAPETIANGTAVLDAGGKAHVEAMVPLHAEDGYLAIRAVVTGPDRTAVTGSGGVGYSAVPLTVALKTDKHLYGAEGTAHVTIKAQLADGRPAAGRRGILTAALDRDAGAGRAPEEIETASMPFTTAADGTAVIDVPFGENGRYRLSVALPRAPGERAGTPAAAALHVYVVGDRVDVGFSGNRVEIVADRDDYAVGDTARILVLAPVGLRPLLATVEGPKLLWIDTPMLGGGAAGAAAVFEVKIVSDHSPNVYVGAALVDRGNVLAATKLLRVPPVDRRLTTVVTADRTEFEPGSKIPISLRVTDSTGAPVAGAEVAVAIVDDSLYGLFSDPAVPLEPFFHSIRRNDVRTGGPIHLECVGWSVAPVEHKRQHGAAPGERLAEGEGAPGDDRAPATGAAPPPPGSLPVPSPESPRPAADPIAIPGVRYVGSTGSNGEAAAPGKKSGGDGVEGPIAPRADFRSAVAWLPLVRTGPDGTASLGPISFADSLTRWRITSRTIDASTRVGTSTTTVRTAKNVLTRLTLPRFLRVNDRVAAPWTLHSLLTTDVEARYVASAMGLTIEGPHEGGGTLVAGALRTEFLKLHATRVGDASVTAELRAGPASDAVRQAFPILPQGIPKVLASFVRSGAGEAITLPPLSLPPTADRDGARLEIHVAPSAVQAVAAALPYLLDYPYGCTEQTMSRLVPVVVAKAAKDAFGMKPSGRLADVDRMIDAGVLRLKALRHADGGFGWWENDTSDPYMTAYVVHGLSRVLALREDAVAKEILASAVRWLRGWRQKTNATPSPMTAVDAFVVMALADAKAMDPGELPHPVADGVLSVPTLARAFLLRAAVALGRDDAVRVHLASLVAHEFERAPTDRSARWEADPIEVTAWVMGAILSADPKHPRLEAGVRWLLSQRVDGVRWKSTRDTAACVAFLTRHAAATASAGVGRTIQLSINGLRLRSVTITAETAFSDAGTVVLSSTDLPTAPIVIEARPDAGAVDVSASLRFTDSGPAIDEASSGIVVERAFWLVLPIGTSGKFRRTRATETVPSGAMLDVDVTVSVLTDAAEFVMVESPHAAGFEPERDVGTTYETAIPAAVVTDHVDRRDDRTVFFVRTLSQGAHIFRHRVRATHVGSFTALPASAEEMYSPEVRGNGKGEVIEITTAGTAGTPGGGK